MGFIGIGVSLVSKYGDEGLILAFSYFFITAVYFFPVLYLLKFSNELKEALALKKLKTLYKYIGIFTIILFGSYILFRLSEDVM